jgi:hypothetical protein
MSEAIEEDEQEEKGEDKERVDGFSCLRRLVTVVRVVYVSFEEDSYVLVLASFLLADPADVFVSSAWAKAIGEAWSEPGACAGIP